MVDLLQLHATEEIVKHVRNFTRLTQLNHTSQIKHTSVPYTDKPVTVERKVWYMELTATNATHVYTLG